MIRVSWKYVEWGQTNLKHIMRCRLNEITLGLHWLPGNYSELRNSRTFNSPCLSYLPPLFIKLQYVSSKKKKKDIDFHVLMLVALTQQLTAVINYFTSLEKHLVVIPLETLRPDQVSDWTNFSRSWRVSRLEWNEWWFTFILGILCKI